RGRHRVVIAAAASVAAFFHLSWAGVSPFTALVQRPVHLALMALLGFLGVRAAQEVDGGGAAGWEAPPGGDAEAGKAAGGGPAVSAAEDGAPGPDAWSWILAALSVAVCLYLATQHQDLVRRSGSPTPLDLAAGGVAVLLVLELARRATGWGLVVVCVVALAYALGGPYLPGVLAHRGYGPERLIEHLYLSTEGIWGVPLGVSADFVYLFVLFGAVLEAAGGGALLIALADRVAGGTRGGPAKTAAVASAFMGSLSGSAVANVVTTGTFTIPLMRRAGFRPFFAGAIEAAASTGGQLMPPVMGAGAFILATWTNIPYVRVATAAIIPALLYYAALLAAIHFRAGKMGIEPGRKLTGESVTGRLHLLLPVALIVAFLAAGRSPMRAAFWGVISAFGLALLSRATRPTLAATRAILESAGRGAVQVAAACAAAGIVVGVASLTGIGLRMSELIVTLSQGNLLVALVLTALGSIVLGMGLPTTAAYVVLAALGAPALVDLGVPLLAAHLFIFYFGCISNVTPPVSLAAFAAAGIAGAPPVRTATSAAVLAGAGFVVPFMFIYGPPLLLEGPVHEIALVTVTALAGVTALAAASMGYGRRPLAAWERLVLGVGALCLVFPGLLTDGAGILALGIVFLRGR
ncbi:MAG TPA: TRAP transporter fused permease subunit, partial [Longimicrobiales bacterium]|nr:TRAP transporter fused permease subunit [Longimicrobiales bacterium]